MRTREGWGVDVGLGAWGVLLLHAFPLHRAMWEPQTRALTEAGYAWLALDYPGFGESPRPGKPLHIDDYADLAWSTATARGWREAVGVGLSMGGYVALSLVRRRPDWLRGLVLADTRAEADDAVRVQKRRDLVDQIRKSGSMEPLIAGHLEAFFTENTKQKRRSLVARVEAWMKSADPAGVTAALEAMAGRPDSREALQRFPRPYLVIVGAQDPLTPPSLAAAMAEANELGRLAVLDGAAHLANLEQPDRFNETLLAYLRLIS